MFKLAVWGLEARVKKFRDTPREKREVTEAASLGSFEVDLGKMLDAIQRADVVPLPAKKIAGAGRKPKK